MKKNSYCAAIVILVSLSACIKTEIVPEFLEPQLKIQAPGSSAIVEGSSLQLNGQYTDALGQDGSEVISWQSRNTNIATVNAAGLVSALMMGQTWMVATAGNLADSVLLTVVKDLSNPATVEITTTLASLTVGDSTQLQARVLNGNNQVVAGPAITWMSSDPAIASVSATGLLRAHNAGTIQIIASIPGLNSLPMEVAVVSPNTSQSRQGNFSGNSGYSVQGTATLTQTGDVVTLLFGANFSASNGPQLAVYLARNASGSLTPSNSLKLANLISNSGAQQYNVPSGTSLNEYNYVVIYCVPFNVRFGSAQLN